MRRRRAGTLMDHLITGSIVLILAVILFPVFSRARDNARRSSCQANIKNFEAALWQYVADNNGISPPNNWEKPLNLYIKNERVFRCPASGGKQGTSDYFFNARFLKKPLNNLSASQTLILMGDGERSPALAQLPASWLKDNYSPAWRHLGGANYGFADGHIKWLKPNRIGPDFRMVIR